MENEKAKLAPSDCLSIIQCSRLMCNTNRELGMLVDYPALASGNSLSRMGGRSRFIKAAVLGGLATVARERTGLDLQAVLDAYVAADMLVAAIPRRYRNEQTCRDLIGHCCASGEVTPSIAAVAGRVDGRTLPLLVLLLLGVLPRVSSREGDVGDIQLLYERLMGFLKSVTGKGSVLETLPVIKHVENEWNSNPGNHNRLFLVMMADMVLRGYGSVAKPRAMGQANRELQEDQFFPGIDGIWVEDESSTVFWRFEAVANGHNLYRYSIRGGERQLRYVKYFIKFFHQGQSHDIALVIHPHSIRYLVEGKPMPNDLVAYLDCTITHDAITFETLPQSERWFTLSRLSRSERANRYAQQLSDVRWKQCNEFLHDEYQFNLALAAITASHLYINTPGDGRYYRVPKSLNAALEQVDFNHTVGVLTMGESETYVTFDDQRLYYDVSTADKMSRLGIEVVEAIGE